jgi:hypothetical protein
MAYTIDVTVEAKEDLSYMRAFGNSKSALPTGARPATPALAAQVQV